MEIMIYISVIYVVTMGERDISRLNDKCIMLESTRVTVTGAKKMIRVCRTTTIKSITFHSRNLDPLPRTYWPCIQTLITAIKNDAIIMGR